MSIDSIRKTLDYHIMRLKNVKKSTIEPYTYEAKSRSKDKIKIQFGTEVFCVYHDGIPTIEKPLAGLDVDEIVKYIRYKLAM